MRIANLSTAGGWAVKTTANPLLLAQVFSSAAGALSMVMAASAMSTTQFTTFSLLMLSTQLCTGATRSFLFQPALVATRNDPDAHIHIRATLTGALCSAIFFLAALWVLGVHDLLWLMTLPIANALPVMTEWLRMRGMALNERWSVAGGDAIRLATTLPGALVLWFTAEAQVFFLFVDLTYLTTVVYLAMRLPRVRTHLSPLHFWRPASSQLADFILAQLESTIPLLIFAGFRSSVYIGGIRMAQSLLGPINLAIWASVMNLMADGATQDSHSKPSELIRRGRKLGFILALFCFLLVGLALLALVCTKFSFRGADNHSMTVGVLLVGVYLLTSGWTYPDVIVMRLLGHHSAATWGRVCVVVGTGAGYWVGYIIGGTDGSLIVAFVCSAIANPLALKLPAAIIFRRYASSASLPAR